MAVAQSFEKGSNGRPTKQMLWDEALLAAIRSHLVPPDVSRDVPHWWKEEEPIQRPLSAIMVDMPAAVDDDMPADPGEQRRGRRKKRNAALPEVVLGANRFESRNCAYFGYGILELR